jgi:hypothetical protein
MLSPPLPPGRAPRLWVAAATRLVGLGLALVLPARAAPLTDPGESVVQGALPAATVLQSLSAIAPTLATCYRFSREKAPAAAGQLVIQLQIEPSGRVAPPVLQLSPSLDVAGFRGCAAGAAANARFPAASGPTTVRWALSMEPDAGQPPLEALPEAVGPKGPPQQSLVPTAEQLKPEVRGELDPALIRTVMARNMNGIRYCYGRALMADPTLQGKVTVSFVIGTSGTVVSASVRESTFPDPAVPSCLSARILRLSFPPPKGGIVVVDWPFTFAPGASNPRGPG